MTIDCAFLQQTKYGMEVNLACLGRKYQKSVFSGPVAVQPGLLGSRPCPALRHDDPLAVEDHRVDALRAK